MKALLITARKRITVTMDETAAGTLVVSEGGQVLFGLKPVKGLTANGLQSTERDSSPREVASNSRELNQRIKNYVATDEFARMPKHKKLPLLIEYFSNSREDMSDLVMDLTDEYKRTTGRRYESDTQASNQMEQDFEKLRPHIDTIITDGELARGWQSRIAEFLDLPGTGGSHRRRIFNAGQVLREFYLSTRVESEPIGVENKKRRAVG